MERIRIGSTCAIGCKSGIDRIERGLHASAQQLQRGVLGASEIMQAKRFGHADMGAARAGRLRHETVERVAQRALAIVVAYALQMLGELLLRNRFVSKGEWADTPYPGQRIGCLLQRLGGFGVERSLVAQLSTRQPQQFVAVARGFDPEHATRAAPKSPR